MKIVHRTVALEGREVMGCAMNMNAEQIEYLSSLQRGYAAVYAEGDSNPKCVKLLLVELFCEKNREDVIYEVQRKIQDIAEGYGKIINHHAECAFCEHRCQYYEKVSEYIEIKIDTRKAIAKWENRGYKSVTLDTFLNSKVMLELGCDEIFEKICI